MGKVAVGDVATAVAEDPCAFVGLIKSEFRIFAKKMMQKDAKGKNKMKRGPVTPEPNRSPSTLNTASNPEISNSSDKVQTRADLGDFHVPIRRTLVGLHSVRYMHCSCL